MKNRKEDVDPKHTKTAGKYKAAAMQAPYERVLQVDARTGKSRFVWRYKEKS